MKGETDPTFHVLIATLGGSTLPRMLRSLVPQLRHGDALTIVFDGHATPPPGEWVECVAPSRRTCELTVAAEPQALGSWGHGVRSKYCTDALLQPRTDFVMHADDDDAYTDGAFEALRRACTRRSTLYFAQKCRPGRKPLPARVEDVVKLGQVGTPCGVIPRQWVLDAAAQGARWAPRRGGDGLYYQALVGWARAHGHDVQLLQLLIYSVLGRPTSP